MKEKGPIKRSQQLAPFSREHHEALVFIQRVKQGLKNGTAFAILRDYINWFWTNSLKNHFDKEEQLLLPQLSAGDNLGLQLIKEHQDIRNIVSKELSEMQIVLFADILNAHIRFEERVLFPHIERSIPLNALNMIFEQLDHPIECATSWKNKFWKSNNQ